MKKIRDGENKVCTHLAPPAEYVIEVVVAAASLPCVVKRTVGRRMKKLLQERQLFVAFKFTSNSSHAVYQRR